MRRSVTLLLALALCLSMAFPAFAAVDMADDIAEKAAPGFVALEDGCIAVVRDAEGNELLRIGADDLRATALSEAESAENLSDEAREILINAYEKFLNPDATLAIQASVMNEIAIEKLGTHNTADSFGVWNMFDLTLNNEKVKELLAQEGNYVEITFNLGEAGNSVIAAMVYANKKWFDVELINNNDGTVTCKFDLFGVVSFLYPYGGGAGEGGDDDDDSNKDNENEDDDIFVPSIGYKPLPDLDTDENGNSGGIVDPDGNVSDIEPECFSFISVAKTDVPHGALSDQERILRSVYNVMSNPNVKLSVVAPRMDEVAVELLGEGHTADDFVIRDLFYMDMVCEEHAGMFPAEGTQMKLVFDLGIAPDAIITGMVYIEGEWIPVEAINNGDDTVTFIFDDICPVAFLVPREQQSSASAGVMLSGIFSNNATSSTTGAAVSGNSVGLWVMTSTVALAAIVVLLGVYARNKKRENA